MKYRFILLDADNTLFDFDACEKTAFYQTMEGLGITPTEAMYQGYQEINDACWKQLEKGQITREELQRLRFLRFAHRFSLSLDPIDANCRYIENLSKLGILIPGAVDFVKALSEMAKVYIITNGIARVQHGRFKDCPLLPYIQRIFISEEIGAAKPDKAFFDRVADMIPDFDTTKAIVIGDSLSGDIKGANNARLDCIWYNPKEKKPGNEQIDHTVSDYNEILHILKQGDPI